MVSLSCICVVFEWPMFVMLLGICVLCVWYMHAVCDMCCLCGVYEVCPCYLCVCSVFLVNSWSMICVWYTHGYTVCVIFSVSSICYQCDVCGVCTFCVLCVVHVVIYAWCPCGVHVVICSLSWQTGVGVCVEYVCCVW